nr:hypothetical protein [Tanacetum cinerariifolium]
RQSEELRKMPDMHRDYQEMTCQFLDKRWNGSTMMVLMKQTVSCNMKVLVVETETTGTLANDVDMVFCSTDVGRSKQVGQKFAHSAYPNSDDSLD